MAGGPSSPRRSSPSSATSCPRRPGAYLERLLEHVWDEQADPFTNTVRVTISNLRRSRGRRLIAADHDRERRGYRLAEAADPMRLPACSGPSARIATQYSLALFGVTTP